MIRVTVEGGGAVFAVRVVPRTSRDSLAGEFNGALKIRLTAPPVEDRANQALCRFLAEHLNLPLSAVRILSGQKSRTKRVAVQGATARQIQNLASLA